jgi:hypothetical protein
MEEPCHEDRAAPARERIAAMKRIVISALASLACWANFAWADCCEHCGCQCQCQKTCRLICETKKETKTTYCCECEDFCVPGPSDRCLTYDECGKKKWVYTPTCATVRSRTKLVKKDVTKEVPAYRWVVENLCESCANKSNSEQQQKPAPAAGKDVLIPQRELDPSASDQPADAYQNVAASEGSSRRNSNLGRLLSPIFGQK